MDERLRGEDLADRRRDRRRPGFFTDDGQLVEDVVEAIARAVRPEAGVDRRHKARGKLVLRGARGDARSKRRHRVVADELVHDLGRLPELLDVDAAVELDPC